MKIFKANEVLINTLIKFGFEETTSNRDKIKRKHAFKLHGKGNKEVYFDYENIQILHRQEEHDSRYTITENELKSLLLFFKLDRADYKIIQPTGRFDFGLVQRRLDEIKVELNILMEKKLKIRRQFKLKRILKLQGNIEQDYQQNI
ncbi:hypothetical protein C7S20_16725 [Christiangramia fulva]|uniref:Uncharacterized protein n=1 Tax=Christiangramia fulva TaxID=2126553 RepID=A0A2R3Z932_9FLAO|nr:hypothetical protein [Christiangramia fulva]AVR46773.1 hypothetical protein C7S20_16725 [Christiangramia fulva]